MVKVEVNRKMRPIKFRAWCNQKMFEPFDLMDLKEPIDYWHDGTILMQFTGLLDKNCKEIWEGDILKYKPFEMLVTVVEFFEGGFWMMNYPKDGHGVPVGSFKESREVLGNIYENPELLK